MTDDGKGGAAPHHLELLALLNSFTPLIDEADLLNECPSQASTSARSVLNDRPSHVDRVARKDRLAE